MDLRNIYDLVKKRIAKAGERSGAIYNLRRRSEEFHIGQRVWRRNYALSDAAKYYSAKLGSLYLGPFRIRTRMNRWVYELEDLESKYSGTWHAKDLRVEPPD